ncbi:MAG TPA: serine protease [Planctomycetota bacterium]|nr:serine protease [Planctomycetota bacterium]
MHYESSEFLVGIRVRTFLWIVTALFATTGASRALDAKPITDSELAAKGKAATVMVALNNDTAFGSAFCIDERGFYLTNCHVIKNAGDTVNVIIAAGEKDQRKVIAKVVRQDEEMDLALLKVDTPTSSTPLMYGSDDSLIETAEVIAFGFPFGKELALNPGEYPSISVNKGRVTSLRKKDGALNRIQIDAVVNPGNSGGPLLDKKGEVVGVVVSGIMGAGAVNFAIPVTHIKKFLSKPAISFTPPALTANTLGDLADFKATLAPSPFSKETYDLDLIIAGGGQPERRVEMKLSGGVYSVKAIPLATKKNKDIPLTAIFADGQISGMAANMEFKVDASTFKLSDAVSIKPGEGTVTLGNGQTVNGAVRKFETVPIRLGNQTLNVDLSRAVELTITSNEPDVALSFTVVAKSAGKEICRANCECNLDGGNAAPRVAAGSSLAIGPAGKSDPTEAMLDGKFIKPASSTARTTYLKVLSTSGDYIGQGKRYEYEGKNIDFKPADGLISVNVDNWRLELAPGM